MRFTAPAIALFASVSLSACADQKDADPALSLPGDIDGSGAPSAGGKADEWDSINDPETLAKKLVYRYDALPKSGKLDKPVWGNRYRKHADVVTPTELAWVDTYWPSADRSHNKRWQDDAVKSPLEKYDAAFNLNRDGSAAQGCETQPAEICGPTAKADWDKYFVCAGPATTWQMKNYHGMGKMFDGIDNNNDGTVDGCPGEDKGEAPDWWWGTCHAWTPASLLEPEPRKAVVVNGVEFTPGDIKALIQNVYDRTNALRLGARNYGETYDTTDNVTASANRADLDTNPGSLHVIMANFIGKKDFPLVEDRTANAEVWNQPVVGYDVTEEKEVTAAEANACVGATGDKWTYNQWAKKLIEVRMTVQYLGEEEASDEVRGFGMGPNADGYHYILEIGSYGKIIGGRYCTESEGDHPDFLWTPLAARGSSNPYVALDKVRELIKKSVEQ